MDDFTTAVRQWLDLNSIVRTQMRRHGQSLLKSICGRKGCMSLREASRRSGLSPTYLSLCLNGKQSLSPDAYVRLSELKQATTNNA
jgi:hypothetical protein